jgi:hypothetical protein
MKSAVSIREEVYDGNLSTLLDEGHRRPTGVSEERLAAFVDVYDKFLTRPNLPNRMRFQEAMGVSDFPYLFADTIDRQLLAQYESIVPDWQKFCAVNTARDFRDFKYYDVIGGRGQLDPVEEFAQYPERAKTDVAPLTGRVAKYGARVGLSWEAIINDDLGALRRLPGDLALAARRTEAKLVTSLYVASTGPHATLYSAGNKNIITSNPALSGAAFGTALGQLAAMVDADGEPIMYDMVTLVVPPGLKAAAYNIKNTMQFVNTEAGATANQSAWVKNWVAPMFDIVVDNYIPIVCTDAAKKLASWFLFASASSPRPAIEVRHLAGEEQPAIFMKTPNQSRVGGGLDNVSFENDTQEMKVRHVIGGLQVEPKATMASSGAGS